MSLIRMHGRFLLVVVACLVVAGLAHVKIKPIGDEATSAVSRAEDNMRALIRTAVNDVNRSGTTANVEIGARRAWIGLLETLVARQSTELSYQELEDFRIPPELAGDENQRANQYADILRRVNTRLGYARYWGPKRITADSAGRNEVEYDFSTVGPGAPSLNARLIRLDLLTRAALTAAASSSSPTFRVTEFRFKEPELEKLKARIPSVEAGRIIGPTGSEIQAPRPMLGRIEAEISLRGDAAEVNRFLSLIQHTEVEGNSGRAIYFENFKLHKDDWRDSGDDMVTFSGTLVATRVAVQAPLPAASIEVALKRMPTDDQRKATVAPATTTTTTPDPAGNDGFSDGRRQTEPTRRRPGGGR